VIILAIDPGTRESGLVVLDSAGCQPRIADHSGASWASSIPVLGDLYNNEDLLTELRGPNVYDAYVIEMKHFHGKDSKAGAETFESCVWIGRFMEAIRKEEADEARIHRIIRSAVRTRICGTARSGDKEVRQALIDRFGGDSVALKGKKCPIKPWKWAAGVGLHRPDCLKCDGSGWLRKPGPLAGITSHMWAALAVAVTWAETQKEES